MEKKLETTIEGYIGQFRVKTDPGEVFLEARFFPVAFMLRNEIRSTPTRTPRNCIGTPDEKPSCT